MQPDPWTYSYGEKPYTVNAYERPERGGQVWVRWTNPARTGREKRKKQSLGLVVRDRRTGQLDPRLVKAAERATQQLQAKLLTEQVDGTRSSPPPSLERPAPEPTSKPTALTLREGFDLTLHPTEGKYPSTMTRRYGEMVKFRDRLFGIGGAEPLIDASLPWTAIESKHARALWRTIIDRYVRARGQEFGPRAAENFVDAIYSVAAWLRAEHHIPSDAARPPELWRKRLKDEWTQRTGERPVSPHRPRHTEAEYRRLFAVLTDPRVDPRLRLAIELAAECRTGQVLRCTRRMLTLTDVSPAEYEQLPAGSLGEIAIPGTGKKHGEVVVFTPEQRRAVDDALAGYLANYEMAYRAGDLEDYLLFPGSRMRPLDESGRRWRRRLRDGVKPLTRDGARAAFIQLEKIAGVPHVEGRGWYGLRRIATDLAETATTDDRVKDRLGGWQDSETRKHIYQDRETAHLRIEAAKVRRQIRLGIDALPTPTADTPPFDIETLLAALTPEQQAALKTRLSPSNSVPAATSAATKRKMPVASRPPALRKRLRLRHLPRAGDRARTGDVQLGKLAFYH
jgi:hypothetical protein